MAEPSAIFLGFKPAHRRHGLIWMIEVGILPIGRRGMPGRAQEGAIAAMANRNLRHEEAVYPHTMDGLLLVAALLATHKERAAGNRGAPRRSAARRRRYCL